MFNRKIDSASLGAWVLAAMLAPMAQFLGSVSWYYVLAIGIGAGLLWLCAAVAGERPCGKIEAALQLAVLALAAGISAQWAGKCWSQANNSWVIPATLLLLAACSAERGGQVGARCGATLFWFLSAMVIGLLAFAIPDVKPRFLLSAAGGNPIPAAAVLLIPGSAMLLPREKGKHWGWAVAILALAVAISAVTQGVLSPAAAAQQQGAFFEMIRGISILGVAERFEAVVAGAMTLSWFCLLSLFFNAVGELGERLRPNAGRRCVWICAAAAAVIFQFASIPPYAAALGVAVFWYLLPAVSTFFAGKVKKQEKGG